MPSQVAGSEECFSVVACCCGKEELEERELARLGHLKASIHPIVGLH